MSLLLKDLIAAGIGLKTANVIADWHTKQRIFDGNETKTERWWELVNLCIRSPGTLNLITGYKEPPKGRFSFLSDLFSDEEITITTSPPPPSETLILEKLIRWAYNMPTIQPINMSPFMIYQLFPNHALYVTKMDAPSNEYLPHIKHYCNNCHEYRICEVISRDEALKRGGYNYRLDEDNYLACKECYPYAFEGLGSLFG